jgi:hypothetical protein
MPMAERHRSRWFPAIEAQTAEERVLIRLVSGEPIGSELSDCDASCLLALADRQKVLFPLAARIIEEKIASPPWRTWAEKTTLAADGEARTCNNARRKTIGLLEAAGICPIVIKGASLSFGNPRDAGDVDILIPEASLFTAIRILESAGYIYRGFERNQYIKAHEYRDWKKLLRWSVQYEFSEPESGILFELHTAFFETARVYDEDFSSLRAATDEFAAASVIDPATGLRFLSLEDRAFLLSLHVGAKSSPAKRDFLLRHLLDLRGLIDAGLDWPAVERRAFLHGGAHHLLLLLRLNERIVGPRELEDISARIEAKLPRRLVNLIRLHISCLLGVGQYSKTRSFAYRLISPFILKGRVAARIRALLVLPLLVPEPHDLRVMYGLPPRTMWVYPLYSLEPIRWAFRLIRKLLRKLRGD